MLLINRPEILVRHWLRITRNETREINYVVTPCPAFKFMTIHDFHVVLQGLTGTLAGSSIISEISSSSPESCPAHPQRQGTKVPLQLFIMKLIICLSLLAPLINAAAVGSAAPAFYPAPCGRGFPHGVCLDEDTCGDAGGFYVGRDCPFYGVGDIGCCYDIPGKD